MQADAAQLPDYPWASRPEVAGLDLAALPPARDGARDYLITPDGVLHCFDAASGQPVFGFPVRPFAGKVIVKTPPLLAGPMGRGRVILLTTFGSTNWDTNGQLAAMDRDGRPLWNINLGAKVCAQPAAQGGSIFVAGHGNNPPNGYLMAFDLRGKPLWGQPFVLPAALNGADAGFKTTPLALGGRVLAGNMRGDVYALDARTGHPLLPPLALGAAVTAGPVLVDGALAVVATSDGAAHVIDAENLVVLASWSPLDGAAVRRIRVYPADWSEPDTPRLVLGRRGLTRVYPQAEWLARVPAIHRPRLEEMAQHAADQCAIGQPKHAAALYARAALLRRQRNDDAGMTESHHRAAQALGAGWLELRSLNTARMVQRQPDTLTFRARNTGAGDIPAGAAFVVSGQLEQQLEFVVQAALPPGGEWIIPMTITPTAERDTLRVEARFGEGQRFCAVTTHPILAAPPPSITHIGDVGHLVIQNITTADGGSVLFKTGDIGLVKTARAASDG